MSAATSPSTTRSSSQSRSESDLEKASPFSASSSFRKTQSSLRRHLNAEVSTRYVDALVILCWFTTGFLDSTIFSAYRTFVSMQTGNTVFIGLGANQNVASTRPYGWLKSLTSLLTFLLGCYFFSRLSRSMGPARRLTLLLSFALQTLLLFLAAMLVTTNTIESRLEFVGEKVHWLHLIPIILLSFQAPGQTCMGRAMGMAEVPTVVVTTMIYDFASDEHLFRRWNPKRNRRFAGVGAMMLGAIGGGGVTGLTGHIVFSLWIVVAIKGAILGAWAVWPRVRVRDGDGEGEGE